MYLCLKIRFQIFLKIKNLPPMAFFSQALQLNLDGADVHDIAPHLAYIFRSFASFFLDCYFFPCMNSVSTYILNYLHD